MSDRLRLQLVGEVLDDDWTRLRRLVARYESELGSALARGLDGDAAALGGRESR